jgi:hypothetical protein
LAKPLHLLFIIHTYNSPKSMGDLQISKQPKKYDAIIVGSGAGGGMAAYTLAHVRSEDGFQSVEESLGIPAARGRDQIQAFRGL